MNQRIVLMNGPKDVGKDSAIKYCIDQGINLTKSECKDHLHILAQNLFNVSEERYWFLYNSRKTKELPVADFCISSGAYDKLSTVSGMHYLRRQRLSRMTTNQTYMLSVRESVIYVSEVLCKPSFGNDYFGRVRVESMVNHQDTELFFDASCAFEDELTPLIKEVGQNYILLIRVHREGYTFEGDSRNYLRDGVIHNTVDVYNTNEEDYNNCVYNLVSTFCNLSEK